MRGAETAFATTIGGALTALLLVSGGAIAQTAVKPAFETIRDVSGAPPGASACLGCHGPQQNEMPSLTRLSAAEIETALDQFRTGAREATLMNRIAKGFTPNESKAIAAWLAEKGP